MPEKILRPVQVFLDTKRLIQAQPNKSFGPKTDFFKDNNEGFKRHKARLRKQLAQASSDLRSSGNTAGFIMVQMREEGLGKSYRPLGALFTKPHRFSLVGGGSIGQMYFQATPESIDQIDALIEQKAEIIPELKLDKNSGLMVERVSAYRSELGAIDEIRVPTADDRLTFSAREGVAWLEQENVIGGYVVELFRPDLSVTPQAVQTMIAGLTERLQALNGIVAVPFFRRGKNESPTSTLSIDLRSDGQKLIEILVDSTFDIDGMAIDDLDDEPTIPPLPAPAPDRSVAHHQSLLDLLANEPLVRRIDLPMRLEAPDQNTRSLGKPALIPPPVAGETYPVVGIVDAGVSDLPTLSPWRVGSAGLIQSNDRDEAHGSFIAGLLTGAGSLNPNLADRFEATPCQFYDLDVLPRRGLMSRYYQTPDEFFDQLELQIEAAKAEAGVRIFNMSLGSPGVRQGLGYSSFAESLDRIARIHDVIFVVSAGNLRGRDARPEWSSDAEQALEMLATRAIAEERITAPGEHLYGLTVGALNPSGVEGAVEGVPTTYSRRGPGPGGARKPELAQVGGVVARGGNSTGLLSIGPDGRLQDGCGTSFATPLVTSSLAAIDSRLHGQAPRETLMALLVHRAEKPKVLHAKLLRAVARDFVGFGVPKHAEACLSDDLHSITLVFADILPPRRELSFDFSWPKSLTSDRGKCRGRVEVTLVHTPPIDAAFDAECQRVQLNAGLHQLEEITNKDGEIVIEPKQRLNHCDMQLPQHLDYTEKFLLEGGLKWTPIKRYEKSMPQGCGKSSEWRLSLKALTRAGAAYPAEGVPFAVVMTILDPKGAAPIYEEVRAEIQRRGLRLADITVEQRLRTRGT